MADRSKTLSVIAIIVGIAGIGLGGYAIYGNLTDVEPADTYVLPKARAYVGTAATIANTETYLDFSVISYDSHNKFNLTSNQYILPETGYYQINAQYATQSYDGDIFIIYVRVNGSTEARATVTAAHATNTFSVSISDIILGSAGWPVEVSGFFSNGTVGTKALFTNSDYTFLSIAKIP